MSLYLCVFAGDREPTGIDTGSYADFNALRSHIVRELEGGVAGSRFPMFILHSDCDGEWPWTSCQALRDEFTEAAAEMRKRPACAFASAWQARVASRPPRNELESFIDVDGDVLLERLAELAELALQLRQPILFQ